MDRVGSAKVAATTAGTASAAEVPGVNPATGLASDYLNHFYEPLLLLEHVESDPDLLDDLATWRPATYLGHFHLSARPDRQMVLDAYRDAQPRVRSQFESLVEEAGDALATALPALLHQARDGGDVTQLATVLAGTLRHYIHRLDSIIHGRETA